MPANLLGVDDKRHREAIRRLNGFGRREEDPRNVAMSLMLNNNEDLKRDFIAAANEFRSNLPFDFEDEIRRCTSFPNFNNARKASLGMANGEAYTAITNDDGQVSVTVEPTGQGRQALRASLETKTAQR